jgi:hypothetical protein
MDAILVDTLVIANTLLVAGLLVTITGFTYSAPNSICFLKNNGVKPLLGH